MKKVLVLSFTALMALAVNAQDAALKDMQTAASKEVKSLDKDGWKKGGNIVINLNQGHLSNWAAGGEQNTMGVNAILNYGLNYKKGKNAWDTYFDIALGMQNATSFGKFRKTDDRFDVTSKYGYQVSKNWYAGVLFNLNTQMLAGYSYDKSGVITKISGPFAPGKVLLSLGMNYKPNDNFSVFISPLTTRWILKMGDYFKDPTIFGTGNVFGVPVSKSSINEIGAYLSARYTKPLNEWATYTGRLDLFSNYKREPQNIDVLFTNLLVMKFNKWLGASISVDVLYDHDILRKTQIKEVFGIGLTAALK